MDAELRTLLTGSLRAMFATGADRATVLDELGWADVRQAHGAAADALLFREQGRALAASTLLDDVVLAELGARSASTTRAVVHPWRPEDPAHGGVLPKNPAGLDEVVLGGADGSAVVAPVPGPDAVRPLAGFGRDTGWYEVLRLSTSTPRSTSASTLPGEPGWPRAVAAAQRALAAELVGLCEAALALAVDHTTNRRQYGRPIGSFQAVRHRLAEAHVAVASAQDVVDVAVDAAARDGGIWEARIAKIAAGRAQAEVMRSVVQFFGALGVTQESVVHRYVARAATLDALYGSHRRLTEQLGRELLDGATLAPVVTIDTATR